MTSPCLAFLLLQFIASYSSLRAIRKASQMLLVAACGALRRFAPTFAHKPALPSSAKAEKAACEHALFLPVADE